MSLSLLSNATAARIGKGRASTLKPGLFRGFDVLISASLSDRRHHAPKTKRDPVPCRQIRQRTKGIYLPVGDAGRKPGQQPDDDASLRHLAQDLAFVPDRSDRPTQTRKQPERTDGAPDREALQPNVVRMAQIGVKPAAWRDEGRELPEKPAGSRA